MFDILPFSFVREIQKRPLLRPLIFWIFGVLLQIFFPIDIVAWALPAAIILILVISATIYRIDKERIVYSNQWLWGVIFMCITVFLAIETTALAEIRYDNGVFSGQSSALQAQARYIQSTMVERLSALRLPDEDKTILATLTLNYRRALSSGFRDQFSVAGVSHLLAVSGFHVGIIYSVINAVLSFLPKRHLIARLLKYALIMLGIWSFAYVSGLATSAVRAAIMLTIYATGIALGRKPDKYNTLSGAALCMLTYNPFYLFDIGFQLSFAAVFFILYLQPRISRLIEVRNPLLRVPWETLTVTVAAQTGVCFLCFFYFGKSSLVFLFTNLFLSMLALILVPTTLMWMNTPEWMPGWNLLRSAIEIMTRALMWTVDRFASLPGAAFALRFDFVTLIGSYIVLGLILLYFRSQRYNTLLAALIVLFAILCWHLLQDF